MLQFDGLSHKHFAHASGTADQDAANVLQEAANKGDPKAQYALGVNYDMGQNVPRDTVQAAYWYSKAAEQDDPHAQFNLAACYMYGEGVSKDQEKAARWYEQAAKQGLMEAEFNLGLCYQYGTGQPQIHEQALSWLTKAAKQGHMKAQFNVALLYLKGQSIEKDPVEAAAWLGRAADQGYSKAQFQLGLNTSRGLGVVMDKTRAAKLFEDAAAQGLGVAQYNLAVCYHRGEGLPRDLDSATAWYAKAADQGHAKAQFNLAVCQLKGEGVPRDVARGVDLLQLAAAQGHAEAAVALSRWRPSVCHYGLLLVRGSKCMLARQDGGAIFSVPATQARVSEKAEHAATRAIYETCSIHPEEFVILHEVKPATVYDLRDGGALAMMTVFIALATHLPARGDIRFDSKGDADSYEWVSYAEALNQVRTDHERKAIEQLAKGVNKVLDDGSLIPELPTAFASKAQVPLPKRPNDMAQTSPAELLPVTVISGFLGAGKTTLLKHVLQNIEGLRVAVIVNDMAEVNIDAQLVRNADVTQKLEKVVEMSNGCICCTLREDLLSGIVELSKQNKYDYVVVESSGISEPLPVAETFTFDDKSTGVLLKDVARLDTMVTVVDGANLSDFMLSKETTSSTGQAVYEGDERDIAQLLVDQIEFANVILLNKRDLLSDKQAAAFSCLINRMNPEAVVYETINSEVSLSSVLNTQLFKIDDAGKHKDWLKEVRGKHKPETEEFGITSFIYRRRKAFHPKRLGKLLYTPGELPVTVLRAKGYMWIASRPNFVGILSCVGHLRSLTQGQPWWAAIGRELWPKSFLDDLKVNAPGVWDDRHGDRAQEVVFIGQFRHKENIEKLLDACLLTDEEMAQEQWDFEGDDTLPTWGEVMVGPSELQKME